MIEKTIRRLIDNAPAIDNPIITSLKGDVPANASRRYLECQVFLKGGVAIAGILTYAEEEGVLQFTSVMPTQNKQEVAVVDHFFGFDDVASIAIGRKPPEQLVRPVRNGGPLIVPGA